MVTSKSGSHDRRGFDAFMQISLVMIVASLLIMALYNWKIGFASFLSFCVTFITLEAISARPDNNPTTFKTWQRTQSRRRPVLLCLGDSLTHGNCGASITPEIPHKLCSALGLPMPDYGKTFSDPLWIVNAGQNCITTHTILNERLHSSMGVFPDFVMILIGTNDVLAIYSKFWCNFVMRVNELPEKPDLKVLDRNLTNIVDFIRSASPKSEIGLCTLVPMGENLQSRANTLVRKANEVIKQVAAKAGDKVTLIPVYDHLETIIEKNVRGWSLPVDLWLIAATLQCPLNCLFGIVFTWTLLSKLFGNAVLTDGVHLNEKGRDIVVDAVVEWLASRNVAKTIAVKSL